MVNTNIFCEVRLIEPEDWILKNSYRLIFNQVMYNDTFSMQVINLAMKKNKDLSQ